MLNIGSSRIVLELIIQEGWYAIVQRNPTEINGFMIREKFKVQLLLLDKFTHKQNARMYVSNSNI